LTEGKKGKAQEIYRGHDGNGQEKDTIIGPWEHHPGRRGSRRRQSGNKLHSGTQAKRGGGKEERPMEDRSGA